MPERRYARRLDDKRIVLYSVIKRRGPDIEHYDFVLDEEEGKIRLIYLGEHAEDIRPRTVLPKQQDLQLYRIVKRRRRSMQTQISSRDIEIDLCSIKDIEVERELGSQGETILVLELILSNGNRLRLEASPKIRDLVKAQVRRIRRMIEQRCQSSP
ncbi:MAG: hypothetical protein ABWW69_04380 [Pyrodictiaceae archaeon]